MLGFPIRKSSDHSSVDSSPRLIAASYVLHRLLVPRHPPCALKNLATKMLASTVQFSNNNRRPLHTPRQNPPPAEPNKQTQQERNGTETEMAPRKNKQRDARRHPTARPLRTQQRTYNRPPSPNPFQHTPTKEPTPTTRRRKKSRRTRHQSTSNQPN